ncbi:MAG: phage tail tube protein [Bacteroidota bacterium]
MPTSGLFVDDDVVITIDGTQFDEIVSWNFDRQVEQIETTSFDSGGDKSFTPGDRSYTLSIEALWKADSSQGWKETFDDIEARIANAWLISSGVTGDTTLGGTGNASGLSIAASKNNPGNVSITIQGSGGITKSTVAP